MSRKGVLNEGGEDSNVIRKEAVKIIEDMMKDFHGYIEILDLKKLIEQALHRAFANRGDCDLSLLKTEAWEIYNQVTIQWLEGHSAEQKFYFERLLGEINSSYKKGTAVICTDRIDRIWRDAPVITSAENRAQLKKYNRKSVITEAIRPWDHDMDNLPFDCEMDMTLGRSRFYLALNYFDEIYTKFEEEMLLDLEEALLPNFKDIVFSNLIEGNFLQNPQALATAIAYALVRFYTDNSELNEKLMFLQESYQLKGGIKRPRVFIPTENLNIRYLIQQILKDLDN